MHSALTAVNSPHLHSSLTSVMSPTTTSSSSSSFSSYSSSSSQTQSGPHYYSASVDVADSPLSTSQPQPSHPEASAGSPSGPRPTERLSGALRLSEPTGAVAVSTVIRPIPRLHASLPPALPPTASSSPALAASTTDKQILPPRIKSLLQTANDGMSSMQLHPSPSAFRPLYSNAASLYSTPSLPSTLFSLSPLHALASVQQGYVLCSFPAQQVQVPVIGWPY